MNRACFEGEGTRTRAVFPSTHDAGRTLQVSMSLWSCVI